MITSQNKYTNDYQSEQMHEWLPVRVNTLMITSQSKYTNDYQSE